MNKYKVRFTVRFSEKYAELRKKDGTLRSRVEKMLIFLQENPFYPSLKTHKVNTRKYGEKYSSRVT